MRIVVAASVIPERRETFAVVLRSLLQEQTRAIDRFDVYLKGSADIPPVFPRDVRLRYIADHLDTGPWTRYLSADHLHPGDVLVTVDDDNAYPPDYVEAGTSELMRTNTQHAVSYGGILWDPLASFHGYIENSWRFHLPEALDRPRAVAMHIGGASFFRAESVTASVSFGLPGFKTNDDMMIANCLQRRGVRIICLPKREGWIREWPAASDAHALFRRDADVRHATFQGLIQQLGFDPTAGELDRYLAKTQRVLVLTDALPPLPGTEDLDQRLRRLCGEDTGVHVLGLLPRSLVGDVMFKASTPYEVHAVTVSEPGGRLDALPPVRAFRNWRVDREARQKWACRERLARERLQPTDVYRYRDGQLVREGTQ